mgnify:CR=1 FL=1
MKKIRQKMTVERNMSDVAILFLRIFIGSVILLHIIGKLQTYDNVVLSYRHILGFDGATSFFIVTALEGLFAAMIIMGVAIAYRKLVLDRDDDDFKMEL